MVLANNRFDNVNCDGSTEQNTSTSLVTRAFLQLCINLPDICCIIFFRMIGMMGEQLGRLNYQYDSSNKNEGKSNFIKS